MKLYRNAIILLSVVLILAGVYFVVTRFVIKEPEAPERIKYEKVVDLSTSDMKEMTIENKGEKFIFHKVNNDWLLTYPENVKYDPSRLSSSAINFSSIFIERVIEEDAADLVPYGLDDPIVVTCELEDGEKVILEVGDLTPAKSGFYVKLAGENSVYTTDTYTMNKVLISLNDLRDRVLISIANPYEEIQRLSLTRDGKTVFKAYNEEGESYTWVLTEPIKGNMNLYALEPLFSAIQDIVVSEFVESQPQDLKKYGLENPTYILEFDTIDESYKMLMGNEDRTNSQIHVMFEGEDEVYKISMELFSFLDKPIEEIVEVFAYIVNIWDVDRMEVEMDGYKLDLKFDTDPDMDNEKDKFYVNGKDASIILENRKQPFRLYYQALIGVTLDLVEPVAQPEGDPEITITYYQKEDSKIMKVEYIPKDDRYYYVVRNGEYSGILVEKKKFDRPEGVRESYANLMEALEAEE